MLSSSDDWMTGRMIEQRQDFQLILPANISINHSTFGSIYLPVPTS